MRRVGERRTSFRLGVLTLTALIAIATASTTSASTSNQWPLKAQLGYLAGCEKSSHNLALCGCQLKWLERRYTKPQFDALLLHHRRMFNLVVAKASVACLK